MRHHPAAVTAVVFLLAFPLAGCSRQDVPLVAGNPRAGAVLLSAHACGACHTIPGVTGADGTLGPSLEGFGNRAFIAGKLPNQLVNLTRWIRAPQSIEPGTAMPNLPVNEAEAQAMAAYLYTLR